MLLPEVGHTKAVTQAGREFTFRPALSRVADLGSPEEIVQVFVQLHAEKTAAQAARYVLATFCEQDDPSDLIGWTDEAGEHAGEMPASEQIIIARHLMKHAIIGKAKPDGRGTDSGKYSPRFDVAEHIAGAVVHLGLSPDAAANLTMTELQLMIEAKFPESRPKDLPTREEYRAQIAAIIERRKKQG